MTKLADLIDFDRIAPGKLIDALDLATPEMMRWSRSGGADVLPPRRLAQTILATLPAACTVGLAELLTSFTAAGNLASNSGDAITLVNAPAIDILSVDGCVEWTVQLVAHVHLTGVLCTVSADGRTLVSEPRQASANTRLSVIAQSGDAYSVSDSFRQAVGLPTKTIYTS